MKRMSRLLNQQSPFRLIRLMAIVFCASCMVIPVAPLGRFLSEAGRTVETEERSEKADYSGQELAVSRPRDVRWIEICGCRHTGAQHSNRTPASITRTAGHHLSTHSDRDLRNGMGSPLLT